MNEAFSCWKFALYEILQIGLLRDFAGPPINCGGPFLKFIVVCLRFIKNVWTLTYAEHFTMWHGDRWPQCTKLPNLRGRGAFGPGGGGLLH